MSFVNVSTHYYQTTKKFYLVFVKHWTNIVQVVCHMTNFDLVKKKLNLFSNEIN
jgi:hypothetical protein